MMPLVPKAGDLGAQLVHDPWAMLRRTTHSKYEPPTPQPAAQALPAPGSAGRERTWLQIAWLEWQGVWSCVGLGSLLSLPRIGSTAK